MLQQAGLAAGESPERLNITAPDVVEGIHRAYAQAGADIITANTFGASRRKLGEDAHAMTITLLLNSEGKKMGKTAKGAVWLDPSKTSP